MLHLGLDLDNTVLDYDAAFHGLALELGLIGPDLPATKQAVRDAVRERPGGLERWVDLQALVYGPEIGRARLAPDLAALLVECRARGVPVSIISHKTRFPAGRPRTDLHAAARGYLAEVGLTHPERGLLAAEAVSFHETRAAKLAAIAARGCTCFVDDLLDVLAEPTFPAGVRRYLFGGEPPLDAPPGVVHVQSFTALRSLLF